jgi:hypothetical protein
MADGLKERRKAKHLKSYIASFFAGRAGRRI